MCNKHIGKVQLLLQILHQVKDLGLDGYVQGRYRLVAYNELWIDRQRPGDSDSLAPAAVQLMGICVYQTLGQSHQVHDLLHLLCDGGLFIGLVNTLHQQRFNDCLADRHPGIQGSKGVLEYNLHILPQIL